MRKIFMIIFLLQFAITGCKQQAVEFSEVENTELASIPTVPDNTGSHVDRPPVVKILKAPQDHLLGESSEVVFEVLEGDNEIVEVVCSIDKFELPCDWLKGVVKLLGYKLGQHLFHVIATDEKGLQGEVGENWQVFQDFLRQVDDLNVDPNANMTDILFVMDNSGSMTREQEQMSQRFNKFISQLKGLDWQIGITTTDGGTYHSWGDGKLVQFPNKSYILKSTVGEKVAEEHFSQTIKRDENGSNTEMGIYTTYRAIERAMDPRTDLDLVQSQFFRESAALAVVVVSDEEEQSDTEKGLGDNLIKLVESKWGKNKVFQFNSIIVHNRECLNGEGVSYGTKYERLSGKTNGVVGDVCSKNYSQMLKNIGKGVANLVKSFNLKCTPQDINNDGKIDLKVKSKNFSSIPGYVINQKRIEFDKALNPGDYEFHYFCLK